MLSAPANASFANTATPTYAGTAPAGSTVTVYVDGAAIGTTTAATNGSFSFAQPTALSQGSHTAYATAQSGGSTGSANSNTNSFTVDTVVPTVAISSTASSPTSTSPIPVTVTFSESVTGFVASDVLVTNGTLSGFAGSGTTYTFTVTPAASGAVTVSVAANVAQDAATNGNTAATPLSIQYVAPAALATVSTATPGAITTTGATLGGNVTADGGSAVAERGVVYSISNTTPTAADTKVSVGSGTGSFSQAVTGLTAGTTYYVRAYATNSTGTSYGGSQTFVTTATAAQNLTVSTGSVGSPVSIAAGTYNNVTVTSTGFAVLSGAVVVNGSFVVTGSLNTNCQPLTGSGSFALQAGSTLYVCDPAGISVSGNTGAVQVSGTRSFSDNSSYSYNGSQPQVTGQGLPAQVLSLSTTNNSPLTLTAPVGVRQVLTVGGAGNLNLNGQALTLRSSAGGTALVVNAGTGLVQGTATVQRFIDGSANSGSGYRHYSAPVANTTVADLATSGFTPTLTQSYNTSTTPGTTTPFPTVFGYDQARLASVSNNLSAFDKGFVVPQANDALVPGRGYAVQIGAGELVDFRGTLGTGLLSVNLLRNSGPTAADAGWALVGNPYPAPLDYSQVLPADRTGLDAAVYMVQSSGPYTGTYRAFVNGQSTTGSNNPLIASGQGFFVRVSQGSTSGQLTFRNGQRVTDYAVAQQTTFQRIAADTRPALRLTLAGSSGTDGWVSYAETSATAGFDREFDAAKLPNPSGLNLSSTTGAELLAIDGRPAFTAATLLPLTVSVPAAGSYSLEAAALANLPAGLTASLRDALTGTVTPLAAGTRYAFTVTAAQAAAPLAGRFAVQFAAGSPLATAPAALTAAVRVYPNPARSSANVMLPGVAGTASVQLELLNAIGQVVLRQQAALPAAGTTLTLPTAGLSTGVYLVRVQLGKAQLTKRLIIE